jgi:hypothetical protein
LQKRPKKQVHQLSLEQEDAFAEELCHISLNAISSSPSEDTIRMRALVKNQVMLTLMDSGSSKNFLSTTFVQKAGLTTLPAPPARVRVADGSVMMTVCPKVNLVDPGPHFPNRHEGYQPPCV